MFIPTLPLPQEFYSDNIGCFIRMNNYSGINVVAIFFVLVPFKFSYYFPDQV